MGEIAKTQNKIEKAHHGMNKLLPGTKVKARGLEWELVLTQNLGEQTLYRLRGQQGYFQGKEFDLLSPLEQIDPIAYEIDPTKAAPLRSWLVYQEAFLLEQSLGASAFSAVQPGRLNIEPYQLVATKRALEMSRPRLLLCDDVGLGKTIQAGLVITELMARRLAHRVLIVTPSGPLLSQWKTELWERFGVRVEVIDRQKVEEIRKRSELGSNPFDHIPLGLVSMDFLKQEKVLEKIEKSVYDIIVMDEAHHYSDSGGGDRDDSLRRRLGEVLSRQCDALLLLTATPHNGYDRSFASLMELIDRSLTDGRGILRNEDYKRYVIRRLKKHIKDPKTGEPKFKKREVFPRPVPVDEQRHQHFIAFQRALLSLIAPELRKAIRNKNFNDVLAFIALLKRSVSTATACLNTLKVVKERFDSYISEAADNLKRRQERRKVIKDYEKKIQQFGILSSDEEENQKLLEAEDIADQLAANERNTATEKKRSTAIAELLDQLIALAEKAVSEDPKLEQLLTEIKQIRANEPKANVLIYTEYTDSLSVIKEKIVAGKLGKILTISGEDDEKTRDHVTSQFRTQDSLILVGTDTAAEGLNLHYKCHHLIHFELPFNPNRLEQRNGRIDRYGQTKTPIVCYLYLQGTFEERILLRLIAKYENQRAKLNFVPDTLGLRALSDLSSERLLKGLLDDDTKLFKSKQGFFDFAVVEQERPDDPSVQELLEEIDKSLKNFEKVAKNNAWIGDTGIHASESELQKANEAQDEGKKYGMIDIFNFTLNSLKADGGSVKQEVDVYHLTIPPSWDYGLEDLPGYDKENRVLRVTLDLNTTEDKDGNTIGYLGRAHPLVRRAIDRARNVSFSGHAGSGQDRRASVVVGKVSKPQLICTFVGTVSSAAKETFAQVVAINTDESCKTTAYAKPGDWLAFCDPDKACNTRDVWKKHFEKWGEKAVKAAEEKANGVFAPLAENYVKERATVLREEKEQIQRWFDSRVDDIVGEFKEAHPDLFENKQTKLPEWVKHKGPKERLSGFARDQETPRNKRAEAETLLRLYEARMNFFNNLTVFAPAKIQPIGLLMIIPGGSNGA